MTLAVENHAGQLWLVCGDRLLAQFRDGEAVKAFWAAFNRSLMVAREVGRQGIG